MSAPAAAMDFTAEHRVFQQRAYSGYVTEIECGAAIRPDRPDLAMIIMQNEHAPDPWVGYVTLRVDDGRLGLVCNGELLAWLKPNEMSERDFHQVFSRCKRVMLFKANNAGVLVGHATVDLEQRRLAA